MCGFAGFVQTPNDTSAESLRGIVSAMANTLYLRGPDDCGVWVDPAVGVALGFRRLSIMDLSPEGHQPMPSASGRYVIVFNGEVYNHEDIRQQLANDNASEPIRFRGHSDTEVILAAVERWGFESAVRRFVGMFALALWDRQERYLYLARDRLGEKPLYYGWAGSSFIFGSELKAFKKHPQFQANINSPVLEPYLCRGFIPAPYSIYEGVFKLLPGTFIALRDAKPGFIPAPVAYWSLRSVHDYGIAHRFDGTDSEAVSQLDGLLRDSVGMQMIADVPLGAFLSGGVDSSTIVALMQAQSTRPVRTFTIGFDDPQYDEAGYARAVARHLGTEHTEVYVTPAEALAVIPRLPELYDEPFADSSQIPTFLVSQVARQSVTVSLSGDGGDELFAGYRWHRIVSDAWKILRWVPQPLGERIALALSRVPARQWDGMVDWLGKCLPRSVLRRVDSYSIHKMAYVLRESGDVTSLHRALSGTWYGDDLLVAASQQPLPSLAECRSWPDSGDAITRLQWYDLMTFLPDDILVKVDRASMGVSLESRTPMLDYRIVEFAASLPLAYKIRANQSKWLLRQVLYQYVPSELIERPKRGFAIPMASWLRGPLRDWGDALLNPETLREQGFFAHKVIRAQWQEHLTGKRDWSYHLWHVLMFQSWLSSR